MKRILIIAFIAVLGFIPLTEIIAQQQNFLTASGNKLFDSTGKEVRLTGVNWFGFETSLYQPHGIWSRDMKSVLQQIKDLGFNTIRVPWCNEMLNLGASVNINSYGTDPYTGISPMNEEETNVSKPIELLDIFVRWCQENDMKIVLDNHSRAADGFLNEAVWYTAEYSEQRWIDDWIFMANRYKNFSAVVAMDLNNEPHGSTWGDSNPATDWNKAAERCGNAVLAVNPDVLIIVEGVGEFEGDSYWWGGQLKGAGQYPVELSNPSKLFYSAHEYGPEVAPQDWFEASNFPNNMTAEWEEHFHYLYENNTSPIFVGEFGIKNQDAFNGIAYTWFTEFMDFMGDIYSWTFWTMNPNSGDTGGILQDDWTSVNEWKMDVLRPHFAPLIPNVVGGGGNLPPVASLSPSVTSGNVPLVVQFNASGSSDPNGDNLTYSWNFGDGTSGSGEIVSHTFTTTGNFQVVLTVSDGALNDTESVTITTQGDTPVVTANIVSNTTIGVAPATINFDATNSTSSDGSGLTYSWSFGDTTTGNGSMVSHEYANEGIYTVTLTATNPDGISDTDTEIITVTTSDPSGDCAFGAPLDIPLATIPNASYSNIYVLGTGGADLGNVTNFTINWDLQNNGLWQFSMNTNNGIPSWWNDLKTKITAQNFNSAEPGVTISGTGFPNFDGSYYVAIDGNNFALVSRDNPFTIYFSNSAIEPVCSNLGREGTFIKPNTRIKIYPNPSKTEFQISMTNSEKVQVIKVYSLNGRELITLDQNSFKNSEITFGEQLSAGAYLLKVIKNEGIETFKLIKE